MYWKPNIKNGSGLTECIAKLSESRSACIFAQDVHVSGAKTFFLCDYEYFCTKLYPRIPQNMKCIYEVLRENVPSKIYIDYDVSQNTPEIEKLFHTTLEKFIEFVKKFLNMGNQEIINKVVVLGADSETKFSRHVIINVFVSNVQEVKCLVESFVKDFHQDEHIDMGVYTKNRCFRILGSSKKGQPSRALKFIGKEFKLEETLIQNYDKSTIHRVFKGDGKSTKRKHEGGVSQSIEQYSPNLQQWCTRREFQIVNFQAKSFKNSQGTVVPTLDLTISGPDAVCGWTKRVHKSNNLFASLDMRNGKLSFRCSDPECPMAPFRVIQRIDFLLI